MKQVNWIIVLTLVVLSGMAAAQLDSGTRIVTQVPFEFVVANKIVPAGQCVVQVATMNGNTLLIRNADSKVALFSPSSQTVGKQEASHYALVFERYGDRYFLSGIKLQDSKTEYRLPKSRAEAELTAQNVSATEEILSASLQ